MTSTGDAAAAPAAESSRRPDRSALRDRLEHALFTIAFRTLALLPRDSSGAVGRVLASAYFRFAPRRRRILVQNLSAAFPDWTPREVRETARRCVDSFGAAVMEFLESPRYSREEMLKRVAVVGEENLAAARRRGKGVFLLSAHFGSWELGAIRAGLLGEPIAPVVRPLDNPLLEEELARRRTRFGNPLIAILTRDRLPSVDLNARSRAFSTWPSLAMTAAYSLRVWLVSG